MGVGLEFRPETEVKTEVGEQGVSGLGGLLYRVDRRWQLVEQRNLGFHFTNDWGLERAYQQALVDNRRAGALLVVGTGGVLSLLPELAEWNVAAVVCIDEAAGVADRINRLVGEISCLGRSEFVANGCYFKGKDDIELKGWRTEREILGTKHLLAGRQRYAQVRQALRKVPVGGVCGDVADGEFMADLAGVLRWFGLGIAGVNLTNVFEYEPKVVEGLYELPIEIETPIVWAAADSRQKMRVISMEPVRGVAAYAAQALMQAQNRWKG